MTATTYTRREFVKAAAAAGLAAAAAPAFARTRSKNRNFIVLGIDGMDPGLLKHLAANGAMPNARRLMEGGGFSVLGTSNPPQSPVAWSDFISGTNPGGHGIYDFIARDPETLTPYLSLARMQGSPRTLRVGRYELPLGGRRMENLRKGATLWNVLEHDGVPCTVIRMPANFPPTPSKARALSGLGTPDIHGGYGIFTFYTDNPEVISRDVSGGRIERVRMENHAARCVLPGPVNGLDTRREHVNVPFDVFADPANPAVLISIQGTELILKEGEWSDWVGVKFPLMPHLSAVAGICRFYLKKARDSFELYVSPVNLDPADPFMPVSTPPDYAEKLARAIGPYYTQGMAEDTSALSAGVLDDDRYRNQASFVLAESLRMFEHEIGRYKGGFFFFYFSCLDLNSHAFWRALDPGHPLYTPQLARKHGDFIPSLYARMDEVIGKAMKLVDENTTFVAVSDHGFAPFRRQFNLNTWLVKNGYARLVRGASGGTAGYFADTDWSGTKAYGLGINSLYLNIKGREPAGTVDPKDADALKAELVSALETVNDPETNERAIYRVHRSDKIYSGPCAASAPDLVVGYNRNYRASWHTVLGKYPPDVFTDNTDPWSGDHALDAEVVPGVLLCNRPISVDDPALRDMAPSILGLAEIQPPREMTGRRVLDVS